MLKKFFIISALFAIILIAFNTNHISIIDDEVNFDSELEYNVNTLFDKGLMICKEVSNLSNFQTMNLINDWYSNLAQRNDFSRAEEVLGDVIYFFSFIALPVDLGLNLIKFSFNCFNILIGSQISIQPDTSYGGGGGGFHGGR